MRYSLVSRFRGTILGAFLGESLAQMGENPSHNSHDLGKMAILGTQSLIKLGRLDLDHWLKRQQQASLDLQVTEDDEYKIILATLPVALFFHENPVQLRQNLLSVLEIWEKNQLIIDSTLAIGYAIAQALTEKLNPITLIPQIIAFIGETPTCLPQQLLKVNSLLAQGAGLEKVQDELNKDKKLSHNIAISFYCFLSTLEDFRLTVLRATHHENFPAIAAITGALSGAYNSTVGIPVNWQILFSSNSSTYGHDKFNQMLELADNLAAVWSGAYSHTASSRKLISVYAAPRVIR